VSNAFRQSINLKGLDIFQEYCNLWKLLVNSSKTKVIVLSKRKGRQTYVVKLTGAELEIVDSLTYLGIVFKVCFVSFL
jgi:hypothetical protein